MIRYNLNFKLFFLIKVFFIYFIICLKSYADTPKALSDLVILGEDNAPVKIKIFSSLTCPHCANFHIKIVPEIKKNYVESGKVQLIFIDFPLDQAAFNASKLLHCVDKKKQISNPFVLTPPPPSENLPQNKGGLRFQEVKTPKISPAPSAPVKMVA